MKTRNFMLLAIGTLTLLSSLVSCPWDDEPVQTLEFEVVKVEAPSYSGGPYWQIEVFLNSPNFDDFDYYEEEKNPIVFLPRHYVTVDNFDNTITGDEVFSNGLRLIYVNTLEAGTQTAITVDTEKWFYRYSKGGELTSSNLVARCKIKTTSCPIEYVSR